MASGSDGYEVGYVAERVAPDRINTPSDDFYNINTTNFNRNPQVKSLILRSCAGKPKPIVLFNRHVHNRPVYLPKHIYAMLSEDIKRSLTNTMKKGKAQYKANSNRMSRVHEQDYGDEEPSETPEPDLDNHYTEALIESHGIYSAKMAFTYHISKHSASSYVSLEDRGANGGVAGADGYVLENWMKCLSYWN